MSFVTTLFLSFRLSIKTRDLFDGWQRALGYGTRPSGAAGAGSRPARSKTPAPPGRGVTDYKHSTGVVNRRTESTASV